VFFNARSSIISQKVGLSFFIILTFLSQFLLDPDPNPAPVPLRQKVAVLVTQHFPTEKENTKAKNDSVFFI
jgi:hypothetical protein